MPRLSTPPTTPPIDPRLQYVSNRHAVPAVIDTMRASQPCIMGAVADQLEREPDAPGAGVCR